MPKISTMFLRFKDYNSVIDTDNLSVIQDKESYRIEAELAAIEEVSCYLRNKYRAELIFKDIISFRDVTITYTAYNETLTYNLNDKVNYLNNNYKCIVAITVPEIFTHAHWEKIKTEKTFLQGDTIEYTEAEFSAAKLYELNDRVVYLDNIYKCTTAITEIAAWDSTKWTLICADKTLYYPVQTVTNQYPDEYIATYSSQNYINNIGQITGWNAATITLYLKKTTTGIITIYGSSADRTANINPITTITYSEAGLTLPLEATITESTTYNGWVTITDYIATNTEWEITLTKAFIQGDLRNAKLKECVMWIALYILTPRIATRLIPEMVSQKYDDMISWLNKIAKGVITIDLPIINSNLSGNIDYGNDTPIY